MKKMILLTTVLFGSFGAMAESPEYYQTLVIKDKIYNLLVEIQDWSSQVRKLAARLDPASLEYSSVLQSLNEWEGKFQEADHVNRLNTLMEQGNQFGWSFHCNTNGMTLKTVTNNALECYKKNTCPDGTHMNDGKCVEDSCGRSENDILSGYQCCGTTKLAPGDDGVCCNGQFYWGFEKTCCGTQVYDDWDDENMVCDNGVARQRTNEEKCAINSRQDPEVCAPGCSQYNMTTCCSLYPCRMDCDPSPDCFN